MNLSLLKTQSHPEPSHPVIPELGMVMNEGAATFLYG
jgi:hypothetical protein